MSTHTALGAAVWQEANYQLFLADRTVGHCDRREWIAYWREFGPVSGDGLVATQQ
jgi:hypothetical protein